MNHDADKNYKNIFKDEVIKNINLCVLIYKKY